MSAGLHQPLPTPVEPLSPGPQGSLLTAELHRFRARRLIVVLAGIGVLGWVLATGIGPLSFGTPTEADNADARARLEQVVAEQESYRQQCLAEAPAPEGDAPEAFCGPPLTEADLGGVESFLSTAPFDLASAGPVGAVAFAGLAAALAFVIGATWIGAEWSSRSMVSLLFWAPRRLRVMGTKLGVPVAGAILLGIAAQVAWLTSAGVLDAVAGTGQPLPEDFWTVLVQTQARGVLLVVLAAVLGFGLTSIVRNTGAALGIAFGYVVAVQLVLGGFTPSWSPWMLDTNVVGLVKPGGLIIYFYDRIDYEAENIGEPVTYYLGQLQSGLVLGAVAVLLVGVGSVLFARRDVH